MTPDLSSRSPIISMRNIGTLRGQNINLRIFNATEYQPRTNDVQGPLRGTQNNRFLYNSFLITLVI